jgi:hypothetical protein
MKLLANCCAGRVTTRPGLSSAVPRSLGPPHAAHAVRWQVFGLAGVPVPAPTGRRVPGGSGPVLC